MSLKSRLRPYAPRCRFPVLLSRPCDVKGNHLCSQYLFGSIGRMQNKKTFATDREHDSDSAIRLCMCVIKRKTIFLFVV